MSGHPFDRPPATSIQEVDLHLRYTQGTIGEVKEAMDTVLKALPLMATTDYIDKLFAKLVDEYAKKTELDTLRAEVADLKVKVSSGSVGSTFDRFFAVAQKLFTLCAIGGGAAVVIAHLVGKLS